MGVAPLSQRERLLYNGQGSMRIKKKLKSVPEAIWSMRIKENAEKKTFPVFNEIKNGDPLQFQKLTDEEKPKRSRHQGVNALHASEDDGVVRGDGGSSSPRQQNNK